MRRLSAKSVRHNCDSQRRLDWETENVTMGSFSTTGTLNAASCADMVVVET